MIRATVLTLGLAGAAHAEAPVVVADIAPVHSLVAMVMEGVGEPELLLPPGASPHDHALRPSEAGTLSEAQAVVWTGEALAPWLGRALDRLAPEAARITLTEVPGTVTLPAREDPLLHDDGHDHGHDHGEADPHAWLDPENGRVWLGAIAEALAGLDPGNAEVYRANAEAAAADLRSVEARVAETVAPFRGTRYVVLHDAFQYFEARFDVPAAAALSIGDATDPGPSRLRTIRDAIRDEGVACAFAEPQLDPGLLGTVAGDAATGVLDPLGVSLEPGPTLYPRLLEALAESLAECG